MFNTGNELSVSSVAWFFTATLWGGLYTSLLEKAFSSRGFTCVPGFNHPPPPVSFILSHTHFLKFWHDELSVCVHIVCPLCHDRRASSITFTYPLTASVAGAPLMTSQSVPSIFFCFWLHCGIRRTPGLSIPRCCLPTSSYVCLAFPPPLPSSGELRTQFHLLRTQSLRSPILKPEVGQYVATHATDNWCRFPCRVAWDYKWAPKHVLLFFWVCVPKLWI